MKRPRCVLLCFIAAFAIVLFKIQPQTVMLTRVSDENNQNMTAGSEAEKYAYLAEVAHRYGNDRLYLVEEMRDCIESLTDDDMKYLANAHKLIVSLGHREAVVNYASKCRGQSPTAQSIYMLIKLLTELGDRRITPFDTPTIGIERTDRVANWERVPSVLQPLVPFAREYGHIWFDEEVEALLAGITPKQKADLVECCKLLNADRRNEALDAFLRGRSTDDLEVQMLYVLNELIPKIRYRVLPID